MAKKLKRKEPPALSPCEACPWRAANQGKKHKLGFYTKANLTRLWNGIRRGNPQSCHPTDPTHPDHVACGAKPDSTPRECAGAVILVLREAEAMAAHAPDGVSVGPEEVDAYWAARKKGLTRDGVLYWMLQRLGLGGVPYLGGQPLPKVDPDDKRIALPEYLEG